MSESQLDEKIRKGVPGREDTQGKGCGVRRK